MKKRLFLLSLLTLALTLILLFWDINPDILIYSLKKRSIKIWAIVVTGSSLGVATLLFQTISGNRILSPSILGLDSLYILVNLIIVFTIGTVSPLISNPYINFFMSTLIMSILSVTIYLKVFSKANSLHIMILVGIVLGILFSSIIGMLQTLMNPDSYNVILDKLFASYNNVNTELLLLTSLILILFLIYIIFNKNLLDVISLGKDKAITLGIDYNKVIKKYLFIIFIMVSLSTSLVGPVTFLGFFAANICKNLFKTYKHKLLIPGVILVSISTLVIGQFLVEKIFSFSLPIGVLISLCGGIYFIFLLLKESE